MKLFTDLLDKGVYAVGTCRADKKGFPTSLAYGNTQPRGTLHVRMHKDRNIAAIHWTDSKGVSMLSTGEDPVVRGSKVNRWSGSKQVSVKASPIVKSYNKNMRGVDIVDQMRGSYTCMLATKKWWHRILWFCFDTSLVNTYVTYKEHCQKYGTIVLDHLSCQESVAMALIKEYKKQPKQRRPKVPAHSLFGKRRRNCVICGARQQFYCGRCDLSCCLGPHFLAAHPDGLFC